MTIKTKRKGSTFERDLARILNKFVNKSEWKRIPGSGAMGTIMNEPALTGDINGTVESFTRPFKIEAKVGYGGATQLTMKKEWLDKIREEAEASYALPFLVGKFSGAREGTKVFVAMDIDTFVDLLNHTTELWEENEKLEKS